MSWFSALVRRRFEFPCTVEIENTAESLHAHVEFDGDFAIAPGGDNRRTGGDDDEQERSPSFRKQAPPFVGGLQEIWWRRGIKHAVLRRRFNPAWVAAKIHVSALAG